MSGMSHDRRSHRRSRLALSMTNGVHVHVSTQIKQRIGRYGISSKDFGRPFVSLSLINRKSGPSKYVCGSARHRSIVLDAEGDRDNRELLNIHDLPITTAAYGKFRKPRGPEPRERKIERKEGTGANSGPASGQKRFDVSDQRRWTSSRPTSRCPFIGKGGLVSHRAAT